MRTLTPQEEFRLISKLNAIKGPLDDYGFCYYNDRTTPKEWKANRNILAAVLMMDAGLRVGEVTGLIFTDVYFNNLPVSILTVRAGIAKGRQERIIPVTKRLNTALARFNQQPYLIENWPNFQHLISAKPQGLSVTTRTIERIITAAGIAALGRPVNPHMLRHTYATKLLRVTDIRTVQELLGHKNLSSTQIYTHVNDEDKRNAIAKMESRCTLTPDLTGSADLPGQVHKQG